jgi:methionyl-tRNA formyltransferase
MRVLFAGTPAAALPSLQAVRASRHEVVAVLTRPDAERGRGRRSGPSPVAAVARAEGLETLRPPTPRDPEFLVRLAEIAPDCCAVVAYGGLLPEPALRVPKAGWVNLHFSLLPAWRGAAPVQRAIMAGDEVTGATTFRLVKELDAGPTYGCVTETIRRDDTAGTLLPRLAEHGAGLLVATLDGIESGSLQPREQPVDGVSLAPKLTVDESEVDWRRPAFAIDRHIRGCTPSPGAWTRFNGQRIKVRPVRLTEEADSLAPGELAISKSTVLVGSATSPVELVEVQPPGKALMPAADWARGLRGTVPALGR